MNTINYIIAGIIVVASLWLLSRCGGIRTVERIVDTVVVTKVVQRDPLVVTDVVTKNIIRRDTVVKFDTVVKQVTPEGLYCSPAFVATLDTVINNDTMNVEYRYPESVLSLWAKYHPDTIIMNVPVARVVNNYSKRTIWSDIGTHGAAFVIGFLFGGKSK